MRPDALRRQADQIERRFDRADGEFRQEADDQLAHLEQQLAEVVADNQRLRDRLQEVDPESPPLCEQCNCPKCRNRDPAMTDHAKTRALVELMDPEVVARIVAEAEARKPKVVETADVEAEPVATTDVDAVEAVEDPAPTPAEPEPAPSWPVEDYDPGPSSFFGGLNADQEGGINPGDHGRQLRQRLGDL